ncbi:MAG: hypothetical protein HGA19_19320 [Oscillochloris sp.]|nr:hypothetical protein [Oscillochloris sp.]
MAALLAALSQIIDLSKKVALEAHEGERGLVAITPPTTDVPPSQLYDAIHDALSAAHLSTACAQLYTGDGQIFVPYTDNAAPHGYDAEGSAPHTGRALLSRTTTSLLPLLHPTPLLNALLQVPLLPSTPSLPTTLVVLTDRRLAALVASYVQRHGLAYGVRFLTWHRGTTQAEVALFDIVSASEVRPVPNFVCDFLRRLPRTALFSDVLASVDLEHEPPRRILAAWGNRPQIYTPHIQELLPAKSILVLGGTPWGAGLIEAPPPRTTMQHLTAVENTAPAQVTLSEQPAGQIRMALELRRDDSAHGPTHALLLDSQALIRLQRMVRHLPAPLFTHTHIAFGKSIALLIAADEQGEIEGVPLGQGLVRAEPPTLLLPRGMRLLPTLPQDLLIAALGIQSDTLTVLTPTSRLDVPLHALQPLSSLLVLDAAAQRSRIEVRPAALPPLDLRDLDDPPAPAHPPRPVTATGAPPRPTPSEIEQRGLIQRLISGRPTGNQPNAAFEQELRRRAADLEQRGEYELAAAFYTYANDNKRAAACYRRLTERTHS